MQNIQSMKQSVQKGFTLIELMIVVAIIGILAALAIPAYQDYTIKSRVSEGASLSGAYKTAVELYWSENGTVAGISTTTLGLTSPSAQYVSAVDINTTDYGIEVTLKTSTSLGEASGDCFTYEPARATGSNITWTIAAGCSSGNAVPTKYLPKT
jgi:type IV pilus assembly protein PilA